MPSVAYTRPVYFGGVPTTPTPPPTPTASPGYPPPPPVTTVQRHTTGACGCGTSHAASSPAVAGAVAVSEPEAPRFITSNLRTPEGFTPPPIAGDTMFDLSKIPANWKTDWWKYVVGAVAYRLFFD